MLWPLSIWPMTGMSFTSGMLTVAPIEIKNPADF
jgi:hypothetical protein